MTGTTETIVATHKRRKGARSPCERAAGTCERARIGQNKHTKVSWRSVLHASVLLSDFFWNMYVGSSISCGSRLHANALHIYTFVVVFITTVKMQDVNLISRNQITAVI